MSKHTPTPWRAHAELILADGPDEEVDDILARTTNIQGNEQANAAFIVRAVNSHDALVSALKNITDCYGVGYGNPAKFVEAVHDFMLDGLAALAAEKEEAA